jgi:hypothetical protein
MLWTRSLVQNRLNVGSRDVRSTYRPYELRIRRIPGNGWLALGAGTYVLLQRYMYQVL